LSNDINPASDTPQAPASRSNPLLLYVLSASNFVIGMGAFIVIGLLNPIADGFALSPAQAGWVMTAYAISYAILSPILVSATGRIGRRRILTIGLGIFTAASLAGAASPDVNTLFATRVLAAAGAGMFTPVAAAVAAGLSAPERQARALATIYFGLTLAQVVGVPAGAYIAYTFGWRTAFVIVAVLALPCIWLVWNRVPAKLSFQPATLADLGSILSQPKLMFAILFTTSFLGSVYIRFTYVTPLLASQMGFGRDGITLALLMFGIGAVIGNILGGMAADRFGSVRPLIALCVAQAVVAPVFSMLPINPIVLMALLVFWSVSGWSFLAAQQVRLIALSPANASIMLSLNAAAIYVGAAVGSAIGSIAIDTFGINALGYTSAVFALFAGLHIYLSNRIAPTS
jgi:predicted MFS family arabinose efflux permease